jgi:2-haloacid dehalogenase
VTMNRPAVVVFDVNETLSDMSPMAQRFADIGAPPHLAKLWFATLLRDGFALTCAGTTQTFATLGDGALQQVLAGVPINRDVEDAVQHVMAGFASLDLHPDVADGVRALRASGLRLVTLSNGAIGVAHGLLERAGLRSEFEALLSVEDAGIWKPARGAYEHAARACGTALRDMMLVAVHPWDIDGASRAGMATAWIARAGDRYPGYFTSPNLTVKALTELAAQLSS